GVFRLRAPSLDSLGALNASMAGFSDTRDFGVATGDLVVGAGESITARNVKLTADAGSVVVSGVIDTSATSGGGRVELNGATAVKVLAGARIDASGRSAGTAPADRYSDGGLIRLSSPEGTLAFESGAVLDVGAYGKGDAGRIEFILPAGGIANATLAGTLLGRRGADGSAAAGEVAVYGHQRTLLNADGASPSIDNSGALAVYAGFMSDPGYTGLRDGLVADGRLQLGDGLTKAEVK